jgi:hypothetical protein
MNVLSFIRQPKTGNYASARSRRSFQRMPSLFQNSPVDDQIEIKIRIVALLSQVPHTSLNPSGPGDLLPNPAAQQQANRSLDGAMLIRSDIPER